VNLSQIRRLLAGKHTRICLAYLVLASTYILVSGWFVAWRHPEDFDGLRLELLKGLAFVAITTGVLWELLRRAYGRGKLGTFGFKALVECMPDAVIVLRLPDCSIEYANPAAEHMFGYGLAELRSISTERLHVSPKHFRDFHELSAPAIAADGVYHGEFRMRRRDGSAFPTEHFVSTFATEDGAEFALSIIRDITERHEREAALRQSEERLRQIVESIREVLWITTPDRAVMEYVSPGYQKIWGRSPEPLYADPKAFLDTVHPEDRERIAAMVSQQPEGPLESEYRILRPDGEVVWIWDRAVPVRDEDGRVHRVVGVCDDITALKRAEVQLHQAQKLDALGKLAGGMAHDFNNLLTVILGSLDNVCASAAPLPDDNRRQVEAALKAAERAAELTRQLLAFSRAQALEPQLLEVNEMLDDLLRLASRTLPANIELVTELTPSLPDIRVDRTQLESAILNVIINARDAMPAEGRITLRTARRRLESPAADAILAASAGDYVSIEISDTGTGVDAAIRERIFEPFFTTKPMGKGTGLGLSSTFGFIQQSAGGIELDSAPGQGTRFCFLLPVATASQARAPEPRRSGLQGGDESAGRRVLLVDDDPDVRATVAAQLRSLGCEPVEAADARAALEYLERDAASLDLVMSDYAMPGGLNGRDLAREVKRRWPGLRFLLYTGFADEAGTKGTAGGEPPMLAKPFRTEELGRKLRELLAASRPD
jgi:two-component system, cell cycle sensor histidine kinase and response regulator CckA